MRWCGEIGQVAGKFVEGFGGGVTFTEMDCFLSALSFVSDSLYFPLLQIFLLSFASAKER